MTHDDATATPATPPIWSGGGVKLFEALYSGLPGAGWETGRPQPAFCELARAGAFSGPILDVGCGTGENVLMAAQLGLEATGVDAAPSAIATAKRKAADRGVAARFLQWDALNLTEFGEQFDTVLDSGLFHCFSEGERPAVVANLAAVVRPGGRLFMMAFSDLQPGTAGPKRISELELRDSFATGWRIDALDRCRIDVVYDVDGAHAWLAAMTRI